MKTIFCLLLVAAALLSANAHEWKCKNEPAVLTEDMMKIFIKCHDEAGEEEHLEMMDKFYNTKICVWKDEQVMVLNEGKLDWDKLKIMMGGVFKDGIGEGLVDACKEKCESKLEDAVLEENNESGKPFFHCLIETMHEECHKGKEE